MGRSVNYNAPVELLPRANLRRERDTLRGHVDERGNLLARPRDNLRMHMRTAHIWYKTSFK